MVIKSTLTGKEREVTPATWQAYQKNGWARNFIVTNTQTVVTETYPQEVAAAKVEFDAQVTEIKGLAAYNEGNDDYAFSLLVSIPEENRSRKVKTAIKKLKERLNLNP